MHFYLYAFMCLYIGIFLYFNWVETPMPDHLPLVNTWVCFAFLLWGAYTAGKIVVDCISLKSKGQMSTVHMRNGILLAILHVLPTILMSVFMLNEGFAN